MNNGLMIVAVVGQNSTGAAEGGGDVNSERFLVLDLFPLFCERLQYFVAFDFLSLPPCVVDHHIECFPFFFSGGGQKCRGA
jgi:hypothetical protein